MWGGLAHVNIIGSVIFAGMSGTVIADAAGLGTVEIKAMRDHGDSAEFSVGVTGVVMTLNLMIGLLHPPLGMVLFVLARIANLSVERTTMAILPWLHPSARLAGSHHTDPRADLMAAAARRVGEVGGQAFEDDSTLSVEACPFGFSGCAPSAANGGAVLRPRPLFVGERSLPWTTQPALLPSCRLSLPGAPAQPSRRAGQCRRQGPGGGRAVHRCAHRPAWANACRAS
jgi:hypothetical protein